MNVTVSIFGETAAGEIKTNGQYVYTDLSRAGQQILDILRSRGLSFTGFQQVVIVVSNERASDPHG